MTARRGLLVFLAVRALRTNRRRALRSVVMAIAVSSMLLGAVALSLGGSQRLRQSVAESGALDYEVSAFAPGGGPVPIRPEGRDLLLSAGPTVQVATETVITTSLYVPATGQTIDSAQLMAFDQRAQQRRGADLILGRPLPPADNPLFNQNAGALPVLAGEAMAAKLGLSTACVNAGTCLVETPQHTFRVTGIVSGPDALIIDFDTALTQGLITGADRLIVTTRALPATDVERTIDAIASTGGQSIQVGSERAASNIRTGVGQTWFIAIQALALVLLILSTVAQGGLQWSEVNSRHTQIATLRSLGSTPGFSLAQIALEVLITTTIGLLIAVPTIVAIAQLFNLGRPLLPYTPVVATLVLLASLLTVVAGGLSAVSVDPGDAFTDA